MSLLMIAAILTAVSVVPFKAETLYYDGAYTYADIDENSVALYAYEGEDSVLTVPAAYNGKSVTSVYQYAFEDNTAITAINFSQTSKLFSSIGMKSFAGCTAISGTLRLPVSITKIGHAAFQGCSSVTALELNSSVTTIPAQCFNRCSKLRTVKISPFTEVIDNLAFANCPNLKDVYLQTAITSISETAFLNSPGIRLHVYYGSYAYEFAKAHNIAYVLLDDIKLGDVNNDGEVNINDVTGIQRHIAMINCLEDVLLYAADANRDGKVDINDATTLQLYLAHKTLPYPIGETLIN